MYRGVVSTLLSCALLTPSAALGHWHDGDQPIDHEVRPHFHTGTPSSEHHDQHRHGPGGHSHHDDDADDRGLDPASASREGSPAEHDDDAVYVADELAVPARVDGSCDVRPEFWSVLLLSGAPECRDGLQALLTRWAHPPPVAPAARCPLYVRHLALLL